MTGRRLRTTLVSTTHEEEPMNVKDAMTAKVCTVLPGSSLKEAAQLMIQYRVSGLPVVDNDGDVLGVISEGDILFKERGTVDRPGGALGWLFEPLQVDESRKLTARVVGEAMTTPAVTIRPDRPIAAAAALMLDRGVNRLPVVDRGGRLVGILTRADLVRAFARADADVARDIREEVIQRQMWLEDSGLGVEVEAGEVTLRGSVERRDDAEVLPRLTARVPGVVAVHSELTWREES
jgi:CBS domain-containing protein